MHEINNGLSALLRKHDLEISTRAAECKRRHTRLSQRCLALATKTQILRNRGYALDGPEEELALKLKKLERLVFDPALEGRGEEIWARMVNVRERGRYLQQEFEKAGKTVDDAKEGKIDEEVLKQASKVGRGCSLFVAGVANVRQILEDYDKQLTHLSKEMEQIKMDFEEWETAKPGASQHKHAKK
jgi:nuclear pore complex protein Nup54